jgi:hypothetical protein
MKVNKQYYLSIEKFKNGFFIFLKKGSLNIDKLGVILFNKQSYYIYIDELRLNFWIKSNKLNFSINFPNLIILKFLKSKISLAQTLNK